MAVLEVVANTCSSLILHQGTASVPLICYGDGTYAMVLPISCGDQYFNRMHPIFALFQELCLLVALNRGWSQCWLSWPKKMLPLAHATQRMIAQIIERCTVSTHGMKETNLLCRHFLLPWCKFCFHFLAKPSSFEFLWGSFACAGWKHRKREKCYMRPLVWLVWVPWRSSGKQADDPFSLEIVHRANILTSFSLEIVCTQATLRLAAHSRLRLCKQAQNNLFCDFLISPTKEDKSALNTLSSKIGWIIRLSLKFLLALCSSKAQRAWCRSTSPPASPDPPHRRPTSSPSSLAPQPGSSAWW